MRYTDRTFIDETIDIDGCTFERCTFVRCRLVYGGGPPPVFATPHTTDSTTAWVFQGSASSTLRVLSSLYRFNPDLVIGMLQAPGLPVLGANEDLGSKN